jgi:hypothetical protein
MFGHLLGPRSFDSPKRPLAYKKKKFSITLDGINFISTSTITLTTYLMNYAIVVSIIAARFMVNQCPFLLEALT